MSVRKLTFGLLAAVALLAGQRAAEAQEHLPVADPFLFDPDFRWFEPVYDVDLLDMKPSKRASTGWFGTYDRMYLYFSRPDVDILSEVSSTDTADGFDGGYGNRVELGYMLEDDNGWSATFMNITGPNAYESLLVERIDRFNEEDAAGPDDGDVNFDPFGRILPSADRNLAYFNERLYELQDSINVVAGNSFEINKTWRLEPYHYGGILEPMIGFRYMGMTDHWQRESYVRGITIIDELPLEILGRSTATADNNAFGGQVGARYFKFQNRFTLSAEFRAFAMENFQTHRSLNEEIITVYDPTGNDVLGELKSRTPLIFEDNSEFVVGFDVRGEVAYQLTSRFHLRAGFQMIDMARGIWRGERTDDTDQHLVMVGGTFGIAFNR